MRFQTRRSCRRVALEAGGGRWRDAGRGRESFGRIRVRKGRGGMRGERGCSIASLLSREECTDVQGALFTALAGPWKALD